MNATVLRLLDANANRAREALRVLEDYARFVLDDGPIAAELKDLRHELTAVVAPLLPDAILHRDTPGDVGTSNKTQAEFERADVEHVVTAAGKRLGEALRSIEEFLKTLCPADASKVELLRYGFYDTELKLARTIHRGRRFAGVRLYVLITEKLCRRPWLQVAEEAILGGADCLQLREKDLDGGELLRRAKDLVSLCRRHQVLSIINDRPDIAILSDADGVHVGQEDLPAREVRKLLGSQKIVGVSTHRLEQARMAVLDGADYLGVGPFFPSQTKPRDFVAGPEYARKVAESIQIPAVAIAGIDAENVDEVLKTGIRAVAVSSAVICAQDVRAAAALIKDRLGGQAFLPVSPEHSVGQAFLPVSPRPASPTGVGSNAPTLKITRRHLPHWTLDGSTYFITFRVHETQLDAPERRIVLNHLKSGQGHWYELFAAVVMPDHVHVMLKPREGIELSRITKGIKGVTARLLNKHWESHGEVWQHENWDRIIRDQAEFEEKLLYMLNNSVKAGLVDDPWSYDGWYYQPAGR